MVLRIVILTSLLLTFALSPVCASENSFAPVVAESASEAVFPGLGELGNSYHFSNRFCRQGRGTAGSGCRPGGYPVTL